MKNFPGFPKYDAKLDYCFFSDPCHCCLWIDCGMNIILCQCVAQTSEENKDKDKTTTCEATAEFF